MNKLKLGNVCNVINGRAYKQEELLNKGKYKVLRVGNFFTNSSWYYSNMDLEDNKYCIKGDLLFAWSASFGPKIWDQDKTIYHYHIWKLVEDKKFIDRLHLYYYLLNSVNGMIASKHGSIIPHITKQFIENLPLYYLPDISTQKQISSVLCALDNKIEINNKINEQLEVMVSALYNYWFVQFDFPDENGKPYFSSGGKMKFSPELKRQIPVNWEVKNLKHCLNKNRKKVNIKEYNTKKFIYNIDLKVMPNNSFILKNTNNKLSKTNLFKLEKYDILFGSIRPYLKKAGFAVDDGIVSGTVHQFRAKDKMFNFVLCTLTTDNFFNYAVNNSQGTKMPVINEDAILEYVIPFNEKIINLFEKVVNFKEIISSNIKQNQQLSSLRDWLLPMLMNGQVTFK